MEHGDIAQLTNRLTAFRDARDWSQFHSLKELIISLNLEAAELLELTQWQNGEKYELILQESASKKRLEEECSDVFSYLLLIAERAGIDIVKATHKKIDQNELKYPVNKSMGNSTKYNHQI